jgi:hypothetical protein
MRAGPDKSSEAARPGGDSARPAFTALIKRLGTPRRLGSFPLPLSPNRRLKIPQFAVVSAADFLGRNLAVCRAVDGAFSAFQAAVQSCFLPFLHAVAVASDIDRSGVVQQAVENGGGNDRVAEDAAPVSITPIAA